jgi:hypothetical protein
MNDVRVFCRFGLTLRASFQPARLCAETFAALSLSRFGVVQRCLVAYIHVCGAAE